MVLQYSISTTTKGKANARIVKIRACLSKTKKDQETRLKMGNASCLAISQDSLSVLAKELPKGPLPPRAMDHRIKLVRGSTLPSKTPPTIEFKEEIGRTQGKRLH